MSENIFKPDVGSNANAATPWADVVLGVKIIRFCP